MGSRRWLPALLVASAAAAAFLPALRDGFVYYWDDSQNLINNPAFRGLGWAQWRWMFTTFSGGPYQPLTWLSFGLDYSLWGMDPAGYHLTSLLLHAADAALYFALAKRLLRLARPAAASSRTTAAAALAALLFAAHPLRVEAVAYAPERRTVLAALFYLGSILVYLRRERRLLRWSVVLFALSLLSKGAGVLLPATLLILDVYPLRRTLNAGLVVEKAPYLAVAAVFGAVEVWGYRLNGALLPFQAIGLRGRLSQAAFGLSFYLCKSLLPVGLSPVYRLPSPGIVLLSALLVVELTAVLVWWRREFPAALAAWLHYALTLAPVLGFFQISSQMAGDRHTYLSCLGFPLLVAGALLAAGSDAAFRRVCGLAGAVVLVFASLTWRQTGFWRDSETLWSHAAAVDPEDAFALNNLGVVLESEGKIQDAAERFREAEASAPGAVYPRVNLCALYLKASRLDDAIAECRLAVLLSPDNAQARANLAYALRAKTAR